MNDLIFLTFSGQPLPEVDHGLVCSRQFGGSWKVRWTDDSQTAVPCLLIGTVPYPLDRDDEGFYHLPQTSPAGTVTSGVAGLYRFIRTDQNEPVPLTPELLVEAAHLTAGEYRRVIDALQDLALKIGSAATVGRLGRQRLAEGSVRPASGHLSDTWTYPAEQYLAFAKVVRRQWPLIQRQPASGLRLEVRSLGSSQRERSMRAERAALLTDTWKGQVAVPTRHVDVDANRLLRFIVTNLLPRNGQEIVRVLSQYLDTLSERAARVPVDAELSEYYAASRPVLELQSQNLSTLKDQVLEVLEWAGAAGHHYPVAQAGVVFGLPRTPSRQLVHSMEYGPVYAALRRYQLTQVPSLVPASDQDTPVFDERFLQVAPTSQLYERWIMLAVYQAFLGFGFVPADGARVPTEDLVQKDGGLAFRRKSFTLEWTGRPGTPRIDLDVQYEPDLRRVESTSGESRQFKPDIWLTFRVDGSSPFEVALDAKYRRYGVPLAELREVDRTRAEKYGSFYLSDLKGTAVNKYYRALRSVASFVLHTDEGSQYEYWGERPLTPGGPSVAHRYGSIPVRPNAAGERNLRKLVRCVLMYHLRLDDLCWSCGQRLSGKRVYGGHRGLVYQCDCGDPTFWVISQCRGHRKHRLIKLGTESFHAIHPERPFDCGCPECGDRMDMLGSASTARTHQSEAPE